MKIFEFNGKRNGSYINSVEEDVGVNTDGVWANTEKGLAWRGNGSTSKIVFETGKGPELGTGDFSMEFYYKPKYLTGANQYILYKGAVGTGVGYSVIFSPPNNSFRIALQTVDGDTGYGLINYVLFKVNEMNHVILTADRDGVATGYINGEAASSLDISAKYKTLTDEAKPITISHTFGELTGDLGLVRIYDHILTEKERSQLYSQFLNASPIERSIS